jgi:hypothetical protein
MVIIIMNQQFFTIFFLKKFCGIVQIIHKKNVTMI